MVYSMTAYSRAQNQGDFGSILCEMRSINHRYLEINIHLPEALRIFEMPIRELIKTKIKRGKVEASVRLQSANAHTHLFAINTGLAQELCAASEEIASLLRHPGQIAPTDILRYPGVLEPRETDVELLQSNVLETVSKATDELITFRQREGEVLKQLFSERLTAMQVEIQKVKERLPQVLNEQRDRLLKRFLDAKLELDPIRLEQEMVIFAQRIDVSEEIDRLETHIKEVQRVVQNGGVIGRRLDFLLQELNREANTMGAKSVEPVITHAAVEIKVLIEQIREQVQNIE